MVRGPTAVASVSMTASSHLEWMVDNRFGPFVLENILGRGGMGEVWEAVDSRNGRRVALKLLPPHALDNPDLRARFLRECKLAAQMEHRNVVPVYDFAIDGQPYIAMRLIHGTDLASELEVGPLPPERAVAIIEQIAAALDAAHQERLYHRDVKPSNILLQPDGKRGRDYAWLFDWGIAQPIDVGDAQVTRTGQIVGTLAYVAPERLSGPDADHRADVYSLTIVLFECLTGSKPFVGNEWQVVHAHQTAPPPRLPAHVPAGLNAVIAKGMAKKPDDRFDSASALADTARLALAAHKAHRPAPARALPVTPLVGAAAGTLVAVALLATGLIGAAALVWIWPVLVLAGVLLAWAIGPAAAGRPAAKSSDPTRTS